eukprot:253083-Hanusia_phi.AAC.1
MIFEISFQRTAEEYLSRNYCSAEGDGRGLMWPQGCRGGGRGGKEQHGGREGREKMSRPRGQMETTRRRLLFDMTRFLLPRITAALLVFNANQDVKGIGG